MSIGWFDDDDAARYLDQIRQNADPSHFFLESETKALSYGALFQSVDTFCAFLAKSGVQSGDRVAIAVNDDVQAVVAYVAGLWYGLELAMLEPKATPDECEKTLTLLDPDHLLISAQCQQAWPFLAEPAFAEIRQIMLNQAQYDASVAAPVFPPVRRALEDPHLIVMTSGTTGTPKGVVLSFRAILSQSLNMGQGIDFGRGSRILNLFRLSQIGSIVNGALLALLHGGTFVRPFQNFAFAQSGALLTQIASRPVSHFIFVPSLLSCLFRDRVAFVEAFAVPEFRHFVTTAAPISDDLWGQVEDATGKVVVNSFGSSEVNNVTFSARDTNATRIGTVGQMLNADSRITNAAGQVVTNGEIGELWIRSDTRMTAYLDAPDLTDQVLVDGWIKTGDLAHWSGDTLVYVGRSVESIISGGHTIYPTEINNLLLGHPEVADAFTFGKAHPEWGELVAACIVRDTPDLTVPQISRFLREHLSAHKLPRKIVFVDHIPLNDRGKVKIQEVQKLVP